MTLPQILRVLWARRATLLTCAAILFAIAATISLLLPKMYKATADIIIDLQARDAVSHTSVPHAALAALVATQVDVIQSPRVALGVVDALKLDGNPAFIANWREATGGLGDTRNWLALELLDELQVRPDADGTVIRISYSSRKPEWAATVSNAFVQAYLKTAMALRSDPARQNARFFADRVASSKLDLEAAKARLSSYQAQNNVIDASGKFDIENERLAGLSQQLIELESKAAKVRSRRSRKGRKSEIPEVLSNPVVQGLRARLADADADLSKMKQRLGERHPAYAAQVNQVAALRVKLRSEINRQAASIVQTGLVTTRRTKQIASALKLQRRKVIALKTHRDRMDILRGEIEVAEQSFKLVSKRSTVSSLQSESRQTSASLLTPAVAPLDASSPKPFINSVIAAVLGILIGSFIALMREANGPRIRSVEDLVDGFDLPVLVSLPSGEETVVNGKKQGVLPKLSHLGVASAPQLENSKS